MRVTDGRTDRPKDRRKNNHNSGALVT